MHLASSHVTSAISCAAAYFPALHHDLPPHHYSSPASFSFQPALRCSDSDSTRCGGIYPLSSSFNLLQKRHCTQSRAVEAATCQLAWMRSAYRKVSCDLQSYIPAGIDEKSNRWAVKNGIRRSRGKEAAGSRGSRSCSISNSGMSVTAMNNEEQGVDEQGVEEGEALFLGLDFGTSGARATIMNEMGEVEADEKQPYQDYSPSTRVKSWDSALFSLLSSLPPHLLERVVSISLDATSSTMLMMSGSSHLPLSLPLMYNQSCPQALPTVQAIAPANHTVTAGSSTLCKLVAWWEEEGRREEERRDGVLFHQADFILQLLMGSGVPPTTDYNNALKLGFDPALLSYPPWLLSQPFAACLPAVVAPGTPLGHVSSEVAERTGLSPRCLVAAGTTDSIAAFIAAQVSQPGQAVTSLGSTLAVKLLSSSRVDAAQFGIYSHRLNDMWLVGGASNTGGAVLKKFFSDDQLSKLSKEIDPSTPAPHSLYPLLQAGERFPINDPCLEPRLDPQPPAVTDVEFLHSLLESMATIEAKGYSLLASLGASPLKQVLTAGGGARNEKWTAIRERVLGVPVASSRNGEASYGSAVLARQGWQQWVALTR